MILLGFILNELVVDLSIIAKCQLWYILDATFIYFYGNFAHFHDNS